MINNIDHNQFASLGVNCGQLNLGKGRAATQTVVETSQRASLDLLFLQEPNTKGDIVIGFPVRMQVINKRTAKPKSCIVLTQTDATALLLSDLSCELITVAEITHPHSKFLAASVYLPPADRPRYAEADLLGRLERVLSSTLSAPSRPFILAGDFNAKSALWGSQLQDRRGAQIEELLEKYNLTVVNNDSGPTFVGHRGSSNIDFTAANIGMYPKILDWRIADEDTLSDHRLLTWTLAAPHDAADQAGDNHHQQERFCCKKAEWTLFDETFEEATSHAQGLQICIDAQQVEELAATINEAVISACRASMPPSRQFQRSVPWWTPDLTCKRKEVRALRRRAQRAPDGDRQARRELYSIACREYKKLLENTRASKWREFCSRSSEKDPWGTAYRVLRGKRGRQAGLTSVRLADGTHSNNAHDTAAHLLATFFPEDDPQQDTRLQGIVRRGANEAPSYEAMENDRPITKGEVSRVLNRMHPKKAPGYDGITADIAKRAFELTPDLFVFLFNECLRHGTFPKCWKLQTVRFIPKPRRMDPSDPKSVRPISLLPVIGKVLDKIITTRVEHRVGQGGGFSECQFGFASGRSTIDAINCVLTEIQRAREVNEYCAMIALDVDGAFDNAWWPAIINELERREVQANLIRLIKSYFKDRTAQVQLPDVAIKRKVERGCPQGSCSGPVFWKLLYEGIFRIPLPKGCKIVGFADDTALLVRAGQYKTLKATANEALGALKDWADTAKLRFNPSKTEALFFGKKKQQAPTFMLDGTRIRCSDHLRYLGVIIDKNLNFQQHIREVSAKGKELSHKIAAAARLTWGFRGVTMGLVYQGAIEPAMLYAAPIWATGCKVKQARQLLSAQRVSVVRAANAYRTTSTEAVLLLAQIPPIDITVRELADRWRIGHAQDEAAAYNLGFQETTFEKKIPPLEIAHPADLGAFSFTHGEETAYAARCYTDGSRHDNGDAGSAYVVYQGDEEIASGKAKLGTWSSIFQCELYAMRMALLYIHRHDYAYQECSIISDSLSALLALRKMEAPTALQAEVWRLIHETPAHISLRFHWIRSHTGNSGNDRADELANEAAAIDDGPTAYDHAPLARLKKALRGRTMAEWETRWREAKTGRLTARFIPTLEIREGVVGALDYRTVQLVTGHGNFRGYLARFGLRDGAQVACGCGDGEDTAEHVLLECGTEDRHRGTADRQLTLAGLRWPRTMEEVTSLAGEAIWWAALREFAGEVERLDAVRAREQGDG